MYAVDHEENDAPFPHPADLGRAGRGAPDGTYATRGAVTQATYESWIASHSAKIASFGATVTDTIDANSLDALIYPTAAPYGSVGNNLRLSPNTGLPALTVPMGQATGTETYAGYGGANLELLGRSYSEPTLIAMSYTYEQATRHRSTPRLSGALPRRVPRPRGRRRPCRRRFGHRDAVGGDRRARGRPSPSPCRKTRLTCSPTRSPSPMTRSRSPSSAPISTLAA
jgi:hypothetical protein